MGSLRTVPGVAAAGDGTLSNRRQQSFNLPSTGSIGILGSLGCDAIIDEVLIRGASRPTGASFIRLFRQRANSAAVDNTLPSDGSVAAAQWITDGYATGTGPLPLGNGTGTSTGVAATTSTMRATLTTATSGSNSGVAPLNNVLYKGDLIGYQIAANSAGTGTGASLNNAVGVYVTIVYREIDVAKTVALGDPNYVDG